MHRFHLGQSKAVILRRNAGAQSKGFSRPRNLSFDEEIPRVPDLLSVGDIGDFGFGSDM